MKSLKALFRGWRWYRLRKAHLKTESACQWCHGLNSLEVHHVIPRDVSPAMEYRPDNLITLCESGAKCHLRQGHLGDWRKHNPTIRIECEERWKI